MARWWTVPLLRLRRSSERAPMEGDSGSDDLPVPAPLPAISAEMMLKLGAGVVPLELPDLDHSGGRRRGGEYRWRARRRRSPPRPRWPNPPGAAAARRIDPSRCGRPSPRGFPIGTPGGTRTRRRTRPRPRRRSRSPGSPPWAGRPDPIARAKIPPSTTPRSPGRCSRSGRTYRHRPAPGHSQPSRAPGPRARRPPHLRLNPRMNQNKLFSPFRHSRSA